MLPSRASASAPREDAATAERLARGEVTARERIAGELACTGTEGPAARGGCDELSCGIGEPRIGSLLGGGVVVVALRR